MNIDSKSSNESGNENIESKSYEIKSSDDGSARGRISGLRSQKSIDFISDQKKGRGRFLSPPLSNKDKQ